MIKTTANPATAPPQHHTKISNIASFVIFPPWLLAVAEKLIPSDDCGIFSR